MNNYILIDKKILSDKRLTSNDRIVYFALVALLDQYKNRSNFQYIEISKLIGLAKSSIQKSTHHLNRIKLIKKIQKGNGCEYILNFDEKCATSVPKIKSVG